MQTVGTLTFLNTTVVAPGLGLSTTTYAQTHNNNYNHVHKARLGCRHSMNLVRIYKDSPRLSQLEMPILSRLQSLRRPRGVKSRLGFSRWGFPEWKTIELKQEVPCSGVLAPSEVDPEDRVRQDDLGIDLAVIRREEL